MTKRRAVLEVSQSSMLAYLTINSDFNERLIVSENRLPEDCTVHDVYAKPGECGVFVMILESSHFLSVREGQEYPKINSPQFTIETRKA